MNTFRIFKPVARFALASLAVAFATALASPSTSYAAIGTAAGTKITNTVTVNYNNSANLPQLQQTASAEITITLVPSAVNITPDITTKTVNEGAATSVIYTFFGTANGKDNYSFSSLESPGANISNVNGTQTISPPGPISLAGTSLALAVAGTGLEGSITVPFDSSPGYAATGLVAGGVGTGTLLRIGANVYTVTAITPNGDNTMTLSLNTTIAAGTVLGVGTPIGEQKTFSVSYPSGVLSGAITSTQTANATVTSTTLVTATATSANTVITVNVLPATLTITKTACTTDPATGSAACFGATGNAAPGGTVLYKVLVVNGGTGVAKSVVINDIIQKYLTYNGGSAKYGVGATGTQVTRSYDGSVGGALTVLTDASAVDDGYLYTAGPPSTINYAYPVDLANGNELVLFYAATVN